ncbi:MAG TPA: DEAD/DEAH box helicase [Acidimicrobiales bacterium]|nr:DEAD/DEAH box helicase [Acidimicrobiales bacterium]
MTVSSGDSEDSEDSEDDDDDEAKVAAEVGTVVALTPGEEAGWRVELLLQATDEPSLVVEAAEVWRSGDALQQAARALEAPQEVLLAELGRARNAYPELSYALREAAPTALDVDLSGAYRFLAQVAPALEVAGFGVLLPAWWRHPSSRLGARLRARSTPQSRDGAGLLGADGLQAFDWQAALGEEAMSIAELQALATLKVPLVRVRGRWVELRPGEAEKLAEFLRARRHEVDRGNSGLSMADVVRAAAGVDEVVAGVPVLGVEAEGLVGALLRGELEDHIEVEGTPRGFDGELRPYQQRAVAWMDLLERTGLGACLADDMGLGKTAMVLALLMAERARSGPRQSDNGDQGRGPTLVVCPTSVVGNWKREAERFVPELKVAVHHGTGRSRRGDFSKDVADADIVITTYSLVDRDRSTLGLVPWSRVVLDEAQNVKNPEAKQTRAVRSLKAPRKIALTGTPVENHLGELWSIMEILNPGLLGSAKAFRERFSLPIERYHEEDAARGLRALTRPLVLRRLKTDRSIITDLPEKLEMKVLCNLTREQATLYKAVVDDMLRRIDQAEGIERRGLVLATMLRLKQVCNHPAHYLADSSTLGARSGKLERTVEILDEVLQGNERALVFTQFAEMGAMLRAHLQQRLGCQVAFLHGGVDRKRRDAMVERFQGQEDGELPVLVLSLKAGGTGLNLTRANHVVHFDRWWNPAVEDQATDRAFRIGQHRDVQVRKLICAGTLEDRIDQMIDAKRDLADRIVGTGEDWLTELSTSELADVFRLSSEALGAA